MPTNDACSVPGKEDELTMLPAFIILGNGQRHPQITVRQVLSQRVIDSALETQMSKCKGNVTLQDESPVK